MYVHNNLKGNILHSSTEISVPATEFSFLDIFVSRERLLFVVVYKPPNSGFGNEFKT